jgi:uncharacterized protein YecE (DUF72 family)
MKKLIGCSGYYYKHWIGLFYPDDLPKNKWLIYYADHFKTVEINNTFYRMPDEKAVRNWYAITPADFVFAVKGYRYFTHLKKFNTDDEFKDNLCKFQHIAGLLKEKAGPLLWQLPRNFTVNTEKLEKFCSLLSTGFQHVFEFRNEGWFKQEVYDILSKHNHALCIVSGPSGVPKVIVTTTRFAYIRFHGEGSWYNDNYSEESLRQWKTKLENTRVSDIYAYFNNDINAYAISNAKYFRQLFLKE